MLLSVVVEAFQGRQHPSNRCHGEAVIPAELHDGRGHPVPLLREIVMHEHPAAPAEESLRS